ncbi:MAG: T9SS type A sorting domain-containing protein [Candidatus Sabulitectum sp.]|nr:T9SS type A sorting domain-containing protein [Candidatus Sabulitectum sp.]
MCKILVAALLLVLSTVMNGGRLIRIPAQTDSDFSAIRNTGYEITAGSRAEGWVDVLVDHRFVDETMQKYPEAKLLPLDWSELVPTTDSNEMGFYYGPNENAMFWATLAETNDMVDTPTSYGTSFEGRDLEFIRITNAPAGAPAILFTALTHAREPGSNSVVIDWAQWLTTEYGSDTMATFILDNAQIYIIPIVNPDGYEYNNPEGGNQRKNMNFTTPVASDGIDLNRNYSYMWGYDDIGSSADPYDGTYRGSAALSEPETLAETIWIDSIEPLGGFHYHTYGGYLIFPWGYINSPTPDQSTFESWGNQMAAENGYEVGRAAQILYPVNGDAVDWSYGESTHEPMLFFTPEVDDDGFWGSQNDTTLIVTNNLECRYMNKLLCMNLLSMVGIEEATSTQFDGTVMELSLGSNPVSAVLNYTVSGAVPTSMSVLDVTGRIVAVPADGNWVIPANLQNGIYFLQAEIGNGSRFLSQRFTILR